MKRSVFVYLLAMSATLLSRTLPAQSPGPPLVTVTRKDLPELQKIHTVIPMNGAVGTHPDADINQDLNMDFFWAITKQIEKLTCFKVRFPKDAPPRAGRTPGDGYAMLMTYVDEQAVHHATGIYYEVSVGSMGHTFWDGGKMVYAQTARESAMPQSAVVDTLKALAKDACPGWKQP